MCATCVDVSSLVNVTIENAEPSYTYVYFPSNFTPSFLSSTTNTVYAFVNKDVRQSDNETRVSWNQTYGQTFRSRPGSLLAFSLLSHGETNDDFANHTMFATECLLEWCLKRYENTTVTSGVFSEGPVATWTPTEDLVDNDDGSLIIKAPAEWLDQDNNNTFTTSGIQAYWLGTLLQLIPSISFTPANASNAPLSIWQQKIVGPTKDLYPVIENIADGLTATLRNAATGNRAVVYGTTYRLQQVIQVDWIWLLVPWLVIIAGNIYLVSVIIVNHRKAAPVWKASSLALLFHGIEKPEAAGLAPPTLVLMNMKAKSQLFRLSRTQADELKLM